MAGSVSVFPSAAILPVVSTSQADNEGRGEAAANDKAGEDLRPSSRGSAFAHVELPIPRDRLLHLAVGSTLLFFGLNATFSYAVSGAAAPPGVRTLAWLPLAYSVAAACSSFLLALHRCPTRWAYRIHAVAMASGWGVGLAGALVHAGASGRGGRDVAALFGSTTLAPLAFVAVATVGWIAAWSDETLGVGRVPDAIARGVAPAVPGRRALLLLTAAGFGALVLTTIVDHGADGWHGTEAIAVAAAALSLTVVIAMLPGRGGERIKLVYVAVMLGDVLVGFSGLALHLSSNMEGPPEALMGRMMLQAPPMAPLLFGLLGMLGLLAVAEPAVDPIALEAAWPPRRRRR
jgi:hypothetical protein